MQHNTLRPRQALNKAYLRQKTARNDMERFKAALCTLLDSINPHETEEHAKNHLRDFLKTAFYGGYGINTKGRTDLVIHTGPTTKSTAAVLLEVKRPGNRADMPTTDNLNYKAVHELLLYYLQERVQHQNHDLRHLIVTDVHEWFVFDALEFDRVFYRNSQLRKDFTDWSEGRKSSSGTDFFYKQIAAPAIASLTDTITYTWFDLRESEKALRNRDLRDDVKLVQLYKLFSPPHLLKESFATDANSLDRDFYLELLHIIGLEEVKEGGRKLIRRKTKPSAGSLLEAAYQKLRYEDLISGLDKPYAFGNTREEQLFNVALELCITWMNRILFLKLLEAQLISYHQGDRRYAFMSTEHLREFDDLNELFFDVLAERPANRTANVRQKFAHIPYLNSSLFETTALEKRTLRISNLKDRSLLTVYPQSVLRNQQGKPLGKNQGELPTLEYLLRFLGSYDFGAEGREEIQEENKTLITASVLGLIFEKINGYRDGSFYTPGFITMYMSREAIRRAVVERFNEAFSWELQDFATLRFQLDRKLNPELALEGNRLLNSLRICDPAVGSGHYLVSALNELIVIKWELGLLLNRQGKPLRAGSIEVQNDELIVTDQYGELFSYTVHQQPDGSRTINPQLQEIQETLFHEKQTIIENCLFGVDINPNSVKICRLRLWIELLKNAYYLSTDAIPETSSPVCYADAPGMREGFGTGIAEGAKGRYSELQTLPNIDINIKQGNSLLSRYPLTADLQEAFGRKGHSLQAYREAVAEYKHTNSKEKKKELEHFLEELRQGFRTTLANNDPLRQRMAKLRGTIAAIQDPDLFGAVKVDKAKLATLKKELQKLETEREQIETNKVYEGAFEWRFEFPEVLDETGNYLGFDVVIGNPPYIRVQELDKREASYYSINYSLAYQNYDIYVLFIEMGLNLTNEAGILSYLMPTKFIKTAYGDKLRALIKSETLLHKFIDFGDAQIFEDATTYVGIFNFLKSRKEHLWYCKVSDVGNREYTFSSYPYSQLQNDAWVIQGQNESDLFLKLSGFEKLKNHAESIFVGLQTSADPVYILKNEADGGLYSKHTKKTYYFKDDIIKPLLKGAEIKRYSQPQELYSLIFPYNKINGKYKPIKQEEFSVLYPEVWDYLLECKDKLTGRENGKMNIEEWWSYVYPKNLEAFDNPKIMTQVLSIRSSLTYDESGYYYFVGGVTAGGYGIVLKDKSKANNYFMLGLLNSKIVEWYIHSIASPFRGGYYAYSRATMEEIPIAQADEETKAGIRALVEQVLAAKQADAGADTSALEAEIDLQVYRLYDLTYNQVLLVEPGFVMSREEYEAALYLKA